MTEEELPATEVLIDLDLSPSTLVLDELAALGYHDLPAGTVATADHVIEVMKQEGSKRDAIEEWDLLDKDEITISVTHKRWELDADGKRRQVVTRAEW